MDGINQIVKELVSEILENETYQYYITTKKKLEKDSEKYNLVKEFRAKNFEIQQMKDSEKLFEELGKLEEEYSICKKDELISEYIKAEIKVCNLLKEIHLNILEDIDIDVMFD